MEQKKHEQKTAQILYITMLLVLLITALAVGLVTAAGRRNRPAETTVPTTLATVTTPPEKEHISPSVTTRRPVLTTPPVTAPVTTAPTVTTTPATTPKPAVAMEDPTPTLPQFIMPTIGNVAKTFSIDALVWSNTMEDYRTHNGIDVCASIGEGVMAAADGIVTEVYVDPMMGNTVVIAHDGGAETVYQNLGDDITVSTGDTVKSGEVIGTVGESALIEIAEEPHLHFEMLVNSTRVDPLAYITEATMTIVYEE